VREQGTGNREQEDREDRGDGEDGEDGEDGTVNSTVSQGGFCRNVIINKEKIVPKPAPTCSCAIPRRSERSKFKI
jgi:hypothetical protein